MDEIVPNDDQGQTPKPDDNATHSGNAGIGHIGRIYAKLVPTKAGKHQKPKSHEKPDKIGPDRIAELILSVAIVFFAYMQWRVAKSSSESSSTQVGQLIVAADRVDDAAESFSISAANIGRSMKDAVIQMDRQAKSSDKIATSAESSTRIAQFALQPALGLGIVMGNIGTTAIQYQLNVRNEGGSAAVVTVHYCGFNNPIPNPNRSLSDCPGSIKTVSATTVLPHNSYPIAISIGDSESAKITDITEGKTFFFMPVSVEYPVNGVTRTLKYCFVYETTFKSMGECQDLGSDYYHQKH